MNSLRIDSHQHYWRPARGDYGWLRADVPALAPLLRDFAPADLAPLRARHGVVQTVLVQAADSVAETDFLLEIAAAETSVGGVVGWVDLSRVEAIETLERWAATQPKLKGVRPMLQDLADPDWIVHAPHPDVLRALVRLGLRFDALVKPPQLPGLLRFLDDWPELPVVIDHAAKPHLASGWDTPWAPTWHTALREIARRPRVHCKLSGLLTEMAPAVAADRALAEAALRPVWQTLLDGFGPQRLMWGSDWPVLTLAASYDDWVAVSDALHAGLSGDERAGLLHANARRFYALG